MNRRVFRYLSMGLIALAVLTLVAWATSPDPRFNPATFEDTPLETSLAVPSEAITLAQYFDTQGRIVTLLVEHYEGATVQGVDLADLGAPRAHDPFAVLAALDEALSKPLNQPNLQRHSIEVSQLLPSGPVGTQHIGIGTNFPEHAEEARSDSVFNFPKFGLATPARTTVSAPRGSLLDYEVELCMRFDRPIASVADFDTAVKGLFLCADFTQRIALLELADLDNLDSGSGFSDAKSGVGFFPTGPFLVIPKDWKSFVAQTRMMTTLNDEARQDARGGEMILDFGALTEKVLGDMDAPRFLYRDEFHKLTPSGRIEQSMALMSGTSEGVIFTTPQRHDYIEIAIGYLLNGGPLRDKGFMEFAVPAFIDNERAGGHFLKAGDVVHYRATALGDIRVEVTP